MKFIKYCSAASVAVLGLLVTTASTQAASFSDEEIKEHPCLDQTSLPWRISPAKTADIPAAYKGWSGIWSGYWGGQLCHVLVIKKIGENGVVDFIYGTGQPYYSYGEFAGTITKSSEGQQLDAVLGNGARVKYALITIAGDNPTYLIEGLYRGTTGGQFKPVGTNE